MWLRELPERKMGERGGRLMGVREWQYQKKIERGLYMYQSLWVCVRVLMHTVHVRLFLHLIPPNMSIPALLTPYFCILPLPFLISALSPPPAPLTVIWQAQGWQTGRRQGKRSSGLVLLGSCWLAEELAVRLESCEWPGDWRGGRGELSPRWCDGVG